MDWHPLVVHFPVALSPVAMLADLWGMATRRWHWHFFSYALILTATVAALAAVLTGNVAAEPYRHRIDLLPAIERHENLATVSFLTFLLVSIGRLPLQLQHRFDGWLFKLWLGFALAGSVVLAMAGVTGGGLVYDYGLGVSVR